MLAYYGTRISDHRTRTPEGFLICHDVPLSRTGWYEYARQEIGLEGEGMVNVYRSPEEVFDPLAIASFEGKTITDGHPSQFPVAPDNEGAYHKGHVQNVRAGAGDFSDCTIGDLFIKDAVLINKVDNGLREVSCGYDCEWVPRDDGSYEQRKIRGNHIAVVENGRAGDRIAIRDKAPEQIKQRGETMAFDVKKIFGIGFKEWAKDAEPEAVANAIEAAKEGEKKEDCTDAFPGEGGGEGQGNIASMLQQILTTLQQLVQSDKQVHTKVEGDALTELEGELEGNEDVEGFMAGGKFHPIRSSEGYSEYKAKAHGGSAHTDAADDFTGEVPVLSEEEQPKNPIPGADSKQAILAAIKTMKPVIAAIKDEKERKAATDALVKSFRGMMQPGTQKASYGDLLKVKKIADAKSMSQAQKDEDYGRVIKDKFHRKFTIGGK